MKRLLLLMIMYTILFSVQNINAQSNRKLKTQPVKYGNNIEAPFTAKELSMLKEVYQDKLEQYVLSKPNRVKEFKHLLRNRLVIKKMPNVGANDKFTLLSNVGLFNNYNPNLTRDKVIDLNSFNPLKYNLEFFKVGSSIYKIDNTDYYIIIEPQNLKK